MNYHFQRTILPKDTPIVSDISSWEHFSSMSVRQLLQLQQANLLQVQPRPSPMLHMPSLSYASNEAGRNQLLQLLLIREHENQVKREFQQRLLLLEHAMSHPNPDILALHHTQLAINGQTSILPLERPADEGYASICRRDADVASSSRRVSNATNASNISHQTTTTYATSVAKNGPQIVPTHFSKKDSKWLMVYARLKDYKKKHGDCIVPRGYAPDPRLASWVAEQRKQYKLYQDGKPSSITTERINILQALDFAWSAQETAWSRSLALLVEFKKRNGHCFVAIDDPDFPKLGLWIKEQRRHFALWKQGRPSHMNTTRASELDRIGFCWDTHEATWNDRFKELALYKQLTGSCSSVSTNHPEFAKLGTWIQHQRRQYRKLMEGKQSHITKKRIDALESLGFVWFPREKSKLDASSHSTSSDESDDQSSVSRPVKRQRRMSLDS
ncbi:hypothetical protein MPSEU_000950300 [Mayamaea pseudoterrestris]|nr:hypothetical protein MPSEU_000950300 [Mayamaea pseudoterrestris]